MAATVNRPLEVASFNANGIARRRCEFSEQLHGLHTNVALLSETRLKPHDRFFIPNYHIYRTHRFPGRKGGTTVAVRTDIPHNQVDLPPFQ
jgi:hypothetical protein